MKKTQALFAAVVAQQMGFVTRWTVAGDAAARTITLPLVNSGGSSFNCTVNWGDGTSSTVTAYDDVDRIHTYAADGTYDVEIRGACEGWSFNNGGDKTKITSVIYWGERKSFTGFKYLAGGFYGCSNLTSLGAGQIINAGGLASLVSTFRSCAFTSVPVGFLDQCTSVGTMNACFVATPITTFPSGLLDNLTLVTDMSSCFVSVPVPQFPARFLRPVTATTNFIGAMLEASNLQLAADLFYAPGEQATRFLNKTMRFDSCFSRSSFSGVQGTAPDLWNCDFGETITLDVAPATDWDPGDVITGQSSGATAEVVSRTSALVYKIKKHFGTFTLGEIVGVTGVPAKLADQGAANPTFAGTPVSAGCFGGAGNSLASIDNYNDIPASWK